MFYNGWIHDNYVNCLFVFDPDGIIPIYFLNSPGSWHDSFQADYSFSYYKLESIYNNSGAKVVIYSEFNCGSRQFLIKSGKIYGINS